MAGRARAPGEATSLAAVLAGVAHFRRAWAGRWCAAVVFLDEAGEQLVTYGRYAAALWKGMRSANIIEPVTAAAQRPGRPGQARSGPDSVVEHAGHRGHPGAAACPATRLERMGSAMAIEDVTRCREYLRAVADRLRETRQFTLRLNDRPPPESESGLESLFPAVHARIIAPLLEGAHYCRVYGQPGWASRRAQGPVGAQKRAPRTVESFESYGCPKRGYLELDLQSERVRGDVAFWWTLLRDFFHPVIVVASDRV